MGSNINSFNMVTVGESVTTRLIEVSILTFRHSHFFHFRIHTLFGVFQNLFFSQIFRRYNIFGINFYKYEEKSVIHFK